MGESDTVLSAEQVAAIEQRATEWTLRSDPARQLAAELIMDDLPRLAASHTALAAERDMLRGVIDTYSPEEPCPPTGHWVHNGESGTTVCGHPSCHLRRLLYAARAARGGEAGNGV